MRLVFNKEKREFEKKRKRKKDVKVKDGGNQRALDSIVFIGTVFWLKPFCFFGASKQKTF